MELDSIPVVWRTPLIEEARPLDGLAADDHRLYVLGGGVTAYDLESGERVWQTPPAGMSIRAKNPAVAGGRVFLASDLVLALDAVTGSELWRSTAGDLAGAITAADEDAFYVGTDSHRVVAFDAGSGDRLWNVDVLPGAEYPAYVQALVVSGDTVYASIVQDASPTGHLKRGLLIALDRRTGTEIWRYTNERAGESHDVGFHAVVGPMLVATDYRGNAVLGIDRFTGREVWRYEGVPNRFGGWHPVQSAGGVAYIGSGDTYAYAFDAVTGDLVWRSEIGASASAAAPCRDLVFVSSGALYALDRSNGNHLAIRFFTPEGTIGDEWVRSYLLPHEGRLFFVGNEAVYAVECD